MSRGLRRILVAGGVLMLFALLYVHFCLYLPMGQGPAGPVIDRTAFEQPWTDRMILLVGIGDSVTAGYGATKGYSYFHRLALNPRDELSEMQGICATRVVPHL